MLFSSPQMTNPGISKKKKREKKHILSVARKSFTYIITNRQKAICTVSDCRYETHRNQYPPSIFSCGIKVFEECFVSAQTPICFYLFTHHTIFFHSIFCYIFCPVFILFNYSSCNSNSAVCCYVTFPQSNQSGLSASGFSMAFWLTERNLLLS